MDSLDIDKRFKRISIQEQIILFLNLKDSSKEEKIAAIYRLTHYQSMLQQESQSINLLVRYDKSYEDARVIEHLVNHFKSSYFYKQTAFYGDISELLLAGIFRINRYLESNIQVFKRKKDAIIHILQK